MSVRRRGKLMCSGANEYEYTSGECDTEWLYDESVCVCERTWGWVL